MTAALQAGLGWMAMPARHGPRAVQKATQPVLKATGANLIQMSLESVLPRICSVFHLQKYHFIHR